MNLHICDSQLNTACHTTGSEAELGGFADGVKQSAKPEASGDCHSHSCQQSVWSASVRKPGLAQNCGLVPCGGSGGFTFLVPRVAGPDPSSCFSVSCDSSEDQSPFRTMASCAPSSVALATKAPERTPGDFLTLLTVPRNLPFQACPSASLSIHHPPHPFPSSWRFSSALWTPLVHLHVCLCH